jgi:hypothetical protein
MNCLASCSLPAYQHTGQEAAAGTDNHADMEGMACTMAHGRSAVAAAGAKGAGPRWDLLQQVTDGYEIVGIEPSYVIQPSKGKATHAGSHRSYGDTHGVGTTLDLLLRHKKDRGLWRVVDWKSRKRVADPLENWQLRAQAVAVNLCHGAHTVDMRIGYLDTCEAWPSLEEPSSADGIECVTWLHELWRLLDRIEKLGASGGAAEPHSGPWCEYCPCLSSCPAQTSLALAAIGELDAASDVRALTDEQAGRAWVKLQSIYAIAKRVEDGLKERARLSPIPLPSGKRLALVECQGRMSPDREEISRTFRELGKPLPMKRGDPFFQVREIK